MIAITTVITFDLNNLPDYAEFTNKIKQEYCKKFNHEYYLDSIKDFFENNYLYKYAKCKDLILSKNQVENVTYVFFSK